MARGKRKWEGDGDAHAIDRKRGEDDEEGQQESAGTGSAAAAAASAGATAGAGAARAGADAGADDNANGNKGSARSVADLEAELTVTEAESKRQKTAIDAIAKEYSCPLSLDLPVEPVIAEEGRTYNRADIKKHIDNARDPNDAQDEYKKLRSPVTNQRMGPKLVPAVQVQNMIRSLVESGAIDEDDAKRWKRVHYVRTKANSGDPEKMCVLGDWYYHGEKGLVEDFELSFSWIKKAADLGHNCAKADAGYMLYTGQGTKQSCVEGAILLGFAAAKGSSYAAYYLAEFHYDGGDEKKGYLAKDNAKAKIWLDEAMRLRQEDDKRDAVDLEVVESLREK